MEYWKGQTKRTTQPTARQADVDKVARDIVKYYGATVKANEISGDIKNLTD